MVSKSELRLLLKGRRDALPLGERRAAGYMITERLLEILEPYSDVLMYAAKAPEVETEVAINILLERGKRVIVPIIERESRSLRFSYVSSMEDFVPGTFNVPEPLGRECPVSAGVIEVCVVPMVGFDRLGNRLGYGAGYYDRFFALYPDVPKVGLAFSCQEVPVVPVEVFDVRMDYVVTEKEVIVPSV